MGRGELERLSKEELIELVLRLTHIPTEVADGVSFRAHEGGDGRRHAKCQASR